MTLNVGLAILMVLFPFLILLPGFLLEGIDMLLDCFERLFDRRRR